MSDSAERLTISGAGFYPLVESLRTALVETGMDFGDDPLVFDIKSDADIEKVNRQNNLHTSSVSEARGHLIGHADDSDTDDASTGGSPSFSAKLSGLTLKILSVLGIRNSSGRMATKQGEEWSMRSGLPEGVGRRVSVCVVSSGAELEELEELSSPHGGQSLELKREMVKALRTAKNPYVCVTAVSAADRRPQITVTRRKQGEIPGI